MSYQENAKSRLDNLDLALSTLPIEEQRAFLSQFVGALSNYVTDGEWASCLETALRHSRKRCVVPNCDSPARPDDDYCRLHRRERNEKLGVPNR